MEPSLDRTSSSASAKAEQKRKCFELMKETFLEDPECGHSIQYAVLKALNGHVEKSDEKTIQGMQNDLNDICAFLVQETIKHDLLKGKSAILVRSVCEYYKTMAGKHYQESDSSEQIRRKVAQTGHIMLGHASFAHKKIVKCSKKLIRNHQTILIHGFSSVVGKVLKKAAENGIQFNVLITEANPNKTGELMLEYLAKSASINCHLIHDLSVAHHMSTVDYVFLGAEAVAENGGIANRIGSFTIALCAKTFQKPVYVFTESLKFIREYPLVQGDILRILPEDRESLTTTVDFTPPEFITLLFTDVGVIAPSAVSDELISFFQS